MEYQILENKQYHLQIELKYKNTGVTYINTLKYNINSK